MFKNKPSKNRLEFTGKSYFNPPDSLTPDHIKLFSYELDKEIKSFLPNPISSNISHSEKEALLALKNNSSIVIKKADKGATTVILDRTNYINEAENQLKNSKFYEEISNDLDLKTREFINKELLDMLEKGFIKKSQYEFLLGDSDSHRNRVFYTLPKIHKSIDSWFIPNQSPPGRPIVSDVSSETNEVAKFLSYHLKELASSHPSYLKDTYHFISKIRNLKIPANCALVTLDVKSLYTNIDNKKGIAAVRRMMKKYPNPNRPDSQILKLLELCLSHNTFEFNGKRYIQKNGAAMGHAYCVEYANIYMADWEENVLKKCTLKPLLWVRFIDDIYILWPHGYDSFQQFFNVLNSHDESIQLTSDYQNESINFLDVVTYKGVNFDSEGILDTRVHFKDTDSHQLLHHNSFHPKHTFKSVVKSQVLRFFRICNNLFDFNSACNILFKALEPRHYSKRMLRRIKHDVIATNSGFLNKPHSAGRSHPCNGQRCTRCILIPETKSVLVHGQPFVINSNLNCNSKGVVYLINCLKCSVYYVGETGNPLRTRLNQHINDIKHNRSTSVAEHFNSSLHDIDRDFRITPLLSEPNSSHRKYLESTLIKRFQTEKPIGLNDRCDDIKRSESVIPIILPFSPDSNSFSHKTKALANKHYVSDNKIITAFTRNKNLKDILAPSKLKNSHIKI